MPRAKDDRKPVGTEHCAECGTLARFYQVQKGNRTGYLYRRCECGADQRSGAAVQVKWLNAMNPTGEQMIPHPLQKRDPLDPKWNPEITAGEPEPKPAEPLASSEGNPKTESKKTGIIGIVILGFAGAVALLT